MGLDMYLNANRYVSGYDFSKEKETFQALIKLTGANFYAKHTPSAEIHITVAYWRKANAIHRWFVNNCQKGEDDCGSYYVSREQIEELVALCKEILADKTKAAEILPSQEGFFFGGTNYNEDYFDDLQSTINQLEPLLQNVPAEWDFEYHSSW